MDLEAVRTFLAVLDEGRFRKAADELGITQQAVSKRVAALEKELGVRLLTRTARGPEVTIDGQAFLPHARALLQAEARALASVRPGSRALRVDVIGRRLAPAALLRGFHGAHPEIELDVVTLFDADAAVAALRSGTIDASFRAVTMPGRQLPEGIEALPVLDEPLELLTGPAHALASARSVTPARLAGHRIWVPGIVSGTEWAAYYADLRAAFGLTIEVTGPDFGTEPLLDTVADSPELATLVGTGTRLVWPDSHDLRRIPVHDPTPVYPHSLIWSADNPHPALVALRDHLATTASGLSGTDIWTPSWARPRERQAP
ncbi:LysR family transcriptional regulator [Streptomyces sp. NBC_00094]|uniref:LysR family transcriptional regulator n=1 Tax=Streptomyces sp. NBC_00094 TaxID=2903620 RepID=UPI002258A0E9|nr:LysR family transcriptional regulator [Streptomyces sp. NBC_00094]MCX5388682.1 LysR family transcriptional regulator [Streptomyces sp. NBC_00094]